MQTPEFVAIGDTVIDAFIRLKTAHEVKDSATKTSEICMPFGDKVPFEFAVELPAVGNSANAAVSAARLGLHAALISNVGNDRHGTECIDALVQNNVDTQFIVRHPGLSTNYHYVLWYEHERTILIKHENFPYVLPHVGSPKWLYLSSLGEQSLAFHQDLADYLDEHPEINLVFQPGTYHIKFGTTALERIYRRTKIFFCNLEEAERILGIQNRDPKVLLAGLRTLGPELPVITDGPNGSYTYIDGEAVFLKAYPDQKPAYERTGAGDAYASTFSVALASNHTVAEAMQWGSINAMSVCQYVGAQKGLLNKTQIQEFIKQGPSDWKPVTI